MSDLNNEPTRANDSNPLPKPRAFASLLSGSILVIGALLLRGIYHGPASFPAIFTVGTIIFAIGCLVYSSVQIADQWDKAVVAAPSK